MSKAIELQVQTREAHGKESKKLRKQGIVPGVIYGFGMDEPQAVQVDSRLFDRIYSRAGNVHLVNLRTSETGPITQAFISAVKRDPIHHTIAHVDFRVVNMKVEITAHVPLLLTGESPAVLDGAGLLHQNMDTVAVKVLPSNVPETIAVDISTLTELGSMIHVSDLVIPDGVTLVTDGEEVVARITAPTLEEEPEVAEEAEAAEGEAAEGEAEGESDTDES
jgi:large subunit ribosomal protein L25